jgi:hypothetical protein
MKTIAYTGPQRMRPQTFKLINKMTTPPDPGHKKNLTSIIHKSTGRGLALHQIKHPAIQ